MFHGSNSSMVDSNLQKRYLANTLHPSSNSSMVDSNLAFKAFFRRVKAFKFLYGR